MPAFWDTPRRPMITHTSDSHQIPSQSKTKLQILKNCQKFKSWNCARNFICDTPSEVLGEMYKHEMNPTKTVGTTEQTRDAARTDVYNEIDCIIGRIDVPTDRRTEWNQYTPQQLCCARGMIIWLRQLPKDWLLLQSLTTPVLTWASIFTPPKLENSFWWAGSRSSIRRHTTARRTFSGMADSIQALEI